MFNVEEGQMEVVLLIVAVVAGYVCWKSWRKIRDSKSEVEQLKDDQATLHAITGRLVRAGAIRDGETLPDAVSRLLEETRRRRIP